MNEPKIRKKIDNEKPHIINRIVSGIIDACLIFMLFFGCYILFLNTSIGESYHRYEDEMTVIYDSTLYQTGMGYKEYEFEDNENYKNYRVYTDENKQEYVIVGISAPSENAPQSEWDVYNQKYLDFDKKIKNDASYSTAQTNKLLVEFGLVSLSAFISETVFLLGVPLIDKKRRTIGKIATKTQLYSIKHNGTPKWHQILGSYIFKLLVESIIPFVFLKHTTAFALMFIEFVFAICNKDNRTFHELVSRTRVVTSESFTPLIEVKNVKKELEKK